MNDLKRSAETVASLMELMTSVGGLELKYRITAGAGAIDPEGFERRLIYVECRGRDADLLLDRDAELLESLEHIACKMLHLDPLDYDLVSFDVNGFKAQRLAALRSTIAVAVREVTSTGVPHRFDPMAPRERRLLHLALHESGLQTASSGEGSRRFVTLYPSGYDIPPETPNGDERRRSPRRSSTFEHQ